MSSIVFFKDVTSECLCSECSHWYSLPACDAAYWKIEELWKIDWQLDLEESLRWFLPEKRIL